MEGNQRLDRPKYADPSAGQAFRRIIIYAPDIIRGGLFYEACTAVHGFSRKSQRAFQTEHKIEHRIGLPAGSVLKNLPLRRNDTSAENKQTTGPGAGPQMQTPESRTAGDSSFGGSSASLGRYRSPPASARRSRGFPGIRQSSQDGLTLVRSVKDKGRQINDKILSTIESVHG